VHHRGSGWTRRELAAGALGLGATALRADAPRPGPVSLPHPVVDGGLPVAAALARRRSVRRWRPGALRLEEVAQLLWAAQGATHADGRRAAPSAGALYPLELRLVTGSVIGLPSGVHHYRPGGHTLVPEQTADRRAELAEAAHRQRWIADAPTLFAISGVPRRTAARYGARAERYVAMEVGHAAQNLYLQATALGLGTVIVGAFDDATVARLLALPAGESPLALLPVGRR
jgi:SagB-type dehydrogenase family enzyme